MRASIFTQRFSAGAYDVAYGERRNQARTIIQESTQLDSFIRCLLRDILSMSRVEPFQFEPIYPPGEEPDGDDLEDVEDDEKDVQAGIGNTDWCATNDECYCCQ